MFSNVYSGSLRNRYMANDSAVWGTMSNSWEISFIYSENNRHLIHKSTIMQHQLIRPIQKFNRMNILRHNKLKKRGWQVIYCMVQSISTIPIEQLHKFDKLACLFAITGFILLMSVKKKVNKCSKLQIQLIWSLSGVFKSQIDQIK